MNVWRSYTYIISTGVRTDALYIAVAPEINNPPHTPLLALEQTNSGPGAKWMRRSQQTRVGPLI